ncbi:MAG: hypothetical protein IKZ07_07125 [Akkermansia sp.]|nr:hypothetical protein [Akkermansia sp.]
MIKPYTAPSWPWKNDHNGLPILNTAELLEQYASAVLHRRVSVHELHWQPCDLESVRLYVGRRWEDTFADALAHMNGDQEAMRKYQELMQHRPVDLGLVNGIAADVIASLPDSI